MLGGSIRDPSSAWQEVKEVLEENYGVKRTILLYLPYMQHESTPSWCSPPDTVQIELREAAFRICEEDEVMGAVGLTLRLRLDSCKE
jgi:hypothetical protein